MERSLLLLPATRLVISLAHFSYAVLYPIAVASPDFDGRLHQQSLYGTGPPVLVDTCMTFKRYIEPIFIPLFLRSSSILFMHTCRSNPAVSIEPGSGTNLDSEFVLFV